MQEGSCFGVRYERLGVDALFSWIGGVAARWQDFPGTGEIHSGYLEEVHDARMSVDTPMVINWKKINTSKKEAMDPTL